MSELIRVKNLGLSYPIYSIRAQSIRNTIVNIAVGGKLLKDGHDVVHVKALNGVSFSLNSGDRLGVMGHNGAGKTTLLKVLAGVYEPERGSVEIEGQISSLIDVSQGIDYELTGRENLINMGRVRGFTAKELTEMSPHIIEFTELGPYIDLPIKTYSAGMITRLVFGVATSFKPDILLMDEWLHAGDKFFVDKATMRMNNILESARIIVIASHSFPLIKVICNKLLVLEKGLVKFSGDIEMWDEANGCEK
jgi:lipopolysaccharide transport system ATP-binding protein